MIRSRQKPLDREEVIRRLRGVLPEVRVRYGVASLGLFGSCARETPRRTSDVDLLVEFERTPSLLKFIQLEQYLSDLLGVRVDLVMKTALKPAIARRILKEVVPV